MGVTGRTENHVFLWDKVEVILTVLHRNLICQKLKLKSKIAFNWVVLKKVKVHITSEILCNCKKKILVCTDKKRDKNPLCEESKLPDVFRILLFT